jgi:hypothetical protein
MSKKLDTIITKARAQALDEIVVTLTPKGPNPQPSYKSWSDYMIRRGRNRPLESKLLEGTVNVTLRKMRDLLKPEKKNKKR